MRKIAQCLTVMQCLMLSTIASAALQPFTNANCAHLAMPKTVLLVHATWCGHCKAYFPTYEKVSNLEKYKDWTFYEMANDQFEKVCGTRIAGVPITYKDNMQTILLGHRSQAVLEQFIDK